MAITTSGQISLDDINIELDKASGTMINLNDTYVRALIGKAADTQMSLSEWYGATASTATTYSMQVGQGSFYYKSCTSTAFYGLTPFVAESCGVFAGSLSPTTYSGADLLGFISCEVSPTIGFTVMMAGNRTKSFFTSATAKGITRFTSEVTDLGTDPSSNSSDNYRFYDSTNNWTRWEWRNGSLPSFVSDLGTTITVSIA